MLCYLLEFRSQGFGEALNAVAAVRNVLAVNNRRSSLPQLPQYCIWYNGNAS